MTIHRCHGYKAIWYQIGVILGCRAWLASETRWSNVGFCVCIDWTNISRVMENCRGFTSRTGREEEYSHSACQMMLWGQRDQFFYYSWHVATSLSASGQQVDEYFCVFWGFLLIFKCWLEGICGQKEHQVWTTGVLSNQQPSSVQWLEQLKITLIVLRIGISEAVEGSLGVFIDAL